MIQVPNLILNVTYLAMVVFLAVGNMLILRGIYDEILLFGVFWELYYLPIIFFGPIICAYGMVVNVRNKISRRCRVFTIFTSSLLLLGFISKFYFGIFHGLLLF
jgi:NADH:ubiquinone oxidoreductase subunit 4 (subunit M)